MVWLIKMMMIVRRKMVMLWVEELLWLIVILEGCMWLTKMMMWTFHGGGIYRDEIL